MKQRQHSPDRREFLRRAAIAWPALHAWALAGPVDAGSGPALPLSNPFSIRELRLQTTRLEEIGPFYEKVLGLPVEQRAGSVSIRIGASLLTYRQIEGDDEPYYHVAFNIPENKIDRAIEWSAERIELIPRSGTDDPIVHFRNIDAHSVYFFDPAGNLLEFIARHELANSAEGAFEAADLLNISEIGIVVDDVEETVGSLTRELGVQKYPPSRPPSDRFSALGDANGTLILVRRGRIWLMTDDLPGAVFPTEVLLDGPSPGKLDLPEFPYRLRTL